MVRLVRVLFRARIQLGRKLAAEYFERNPQPRWKYSRPPWADWGFPGPGGKWVWRRGYEPPPGMYGVPPQPPPPPVSATVTTAPDPSPEPRGKIPGELAALIILLIGVFYTIAAPPAELLGRLAALAVALVLGVVLALWADIPKVRVPQFARFLAAGGWALLGFVECYSIVQSANAEHAREPLAVKATQGLPLVVSRYNIRMKRARTADERNRVVFDVPLVNTGQDTLRVWVYYAVDVQPFVSILRDNADVVNAANAVKAQVRAKAKRHKTEPVPIPPGKYDGGLNVTVEVQGPVVSDAAWAKIASGERYVYFYVYAAINDDPEKSVRACGIGDGADIAPRGCPDGLETW